MLVNFGRYENDTFLVSLYCADRVVSRQAAKRLLAKFDF